MVPVRIDGIAPVRILRPDPLGQKLMVWVRGVIGQSLGMVVVTAGHFLEKDQIGADSPHCFAQLMQHEAAVECGKAFVDIDG